MEQLLRWMVMLQLLVSYSEGSTTYVVQSFTSETRINHVTVNKASGSVYVGAVNRLYQLSPDLVKQQVESTGPHLDHQACEPPLTSPPQPGWCECQKTKDCELKQTDSVNKALVVDADGKRLIVCSNLYQGYCEKRSLQNIRDRDAQINTTLVPSDNVSSTVMFIATGPQPLGRVLYIAAERSTSGLAVYKDLVPAVCSRNLSNFQFAFHDFRSSTKKNVESLLRDTFRIHYVHGFSSGDYSYFLMVQKNTLDTMVDADYVTHIARVCHRDERFYSYTELPLQCKYGGINYNLLRAAAVGHAGAELALSLGLSHVPPLTDLDQILVAVFSQSVHNSKTPINESALCVFTMRNIRSKFTATIKDCFQGIGNTGPPHITQPHPCTATSFKIDDNYCGAYDMNTPISTSVPLESEAVAVFPEVLATAITLTTVHDYTVALIGTHVGTVLKVVLELGKNGPVGNVYESVEVHAGHAIIQDMMLDNTSTMLIASTENAVYKVRLEACSRFKSCESCHGSGDPYCGWCSLDDRCGLKEECVGAVEPLQWLPYNSVSCPAVGAVLPQQTQINKQSTTQLQLSVLNLPVVKDAKFQCTFRGYGAIRHTSADVTRESPRSTNITIKCLTPSSNLLPPVPTGEDHITLSLSVRMNEKDHVSTNFTFFDCSQHKSCTSCTNSKFPCTWCAEAHMCTQDREQCHNDLLITGLKVPGSSDTPGPKFCPRIQSPSSDILVSSDTSIKITVQGVHLQDFHRDLRCRFTTGKEVSASKLSHNVIECNEYKYLGIIGTYNMQLQIVWGDNKVLDNPDNIQVKIYKCAGMAGTCGQCLTLSEAYKCGWCDGTRCSIEAQCHSGNWLNHLQTCPDPVVSKFAPVNGPVGGNTEITINGTNLGKVFEDIKDGVTVAGIPCQPLRDKYEPSISIVCTTGASSLVTAGTVKVRVGSDDRFIATSADTFSFVEPSIEDFEPRYGPKSGGTYVTIRGSYLNTGTRHDVFLAGLKCHIVSLTTTQCICKTSEADAGHQGLLKMRFDGSEKDYGESRSYYYTHDPIITDVSTRSTVVSGGLRITVSGYYLNVVQRPMIVFYMSDYSEYYSPCENVNNVTMFCWTPNVSPRRARRFAEEVTTSSEQLLTVTFGFVMDGVKTVKNMSGTLGHFKVYPDPEFERFPDGVKNFQSQSDYLTINGRNLNLVFTKDDLEVKIGSHKCTVTSVSSTQLTCEPPKEDTSLLGSQHIVTVEAGRNVSIVIGKLEYNGNKTTLTVQIIVIVIVIVVVLVLFVAFAIIFAYRYKSKQKDRKLRHMLDIMEARVAKECKEAFAELQTDMTEFTSDFSGLSIPFLNYRSFCMRMLFPNELEIGHPVLNQPCVDIGRRESVMRGLSTFNQLIGNRTFLLLFVRTLEKQPDFSVRSRVRVASLLSVVLQSRMEYHTEILKTLLGDLVDKLMEDHSPKLLLRRTESIGEKMLTNWFSFLLYRFLKECAGEHLFVLFQAVKQQVEKGPIDEITGEARYALSEDKLIRQQIDFTVLVVESSFANSQGTNPVTVNVKVLNCDTISQVKEKIIDTIYKTVPYSQRPSKDQRDIYWTSPRGRIMLQDEDNNYNNGKDEDYKKLNTLMDYHVTDGSKVYMTERQMASALNISTSGLDRSDLSSRYVSLEAIQQSTVRNSPSLSRSGATQVSLPLMSDLDTHDVHRYHLVKPHLNDNHKGAERGGNMVSEVYLTRLLKTKLALQSYVDTLFETLFSTAVRGNTLPLAIKYMFDFLDEQALQHGILDAEVVHTWKSNCLPLRFWVGVIKNPDHVFDIHKTNIVDSCLSIVAQTFMDSCSMSPHNLGKDSPSSKLLYAREIPKYKTWVSRYYQDVKQMPAISDQDMSAMLAEESRAHENEFCIQGALYELYQFASKYHTELVAMLEDSDQALILQLPRQFSTVLSAMSLSSQSVSSITRSISKGVIV